MWWLTWLDLQALFVVSVSVQLATYQFMRYMAKSVRSVDGKQTILDAGIDLNMEGGLGEWVVDTVKVKMGQQLRSLDLGYTYTWYSGTLYILIQVK